MVMDRLGLECSTILHTTPHSKTTDAMYTTPCMGLADFYLNVTTLRSGLYSRNSVCLSSVCNVGAPYSGG